MGEFVRLEIVALEADMSSMFLPATLRLRAQLATQHANILRSHLAIGETIGLKMILVLFLSMTTQLRGHRLPKTSVAVQRVSTQRKKSTGRLAKVFPIQVFSLDLLRPQYLHTQVIPPQGNGSFLP